MAISFGTGGIRGIMGDGEDQFHAGIVSRATKGLADYLLDAGLPRSVVIAYDTRRHSRRFACLAAAVLDRAGVKAYVFSQPTPTPVLSFAVRQLGCGGGIVITASHNPREYNGYKVYNEHGCQLVPDEAAALSRYIDAAGEAPLPDAYIPEAPPDSLREAYMQAVLAQSLLCVDGAGGEPLQVVYTPLHGAGEGFVQEALARDGFCAISSVPAQQEQNGAFPTVRSPNPEEQDALLMAIEQAKGEAADIVLGTDPDCDRVGAAVCHEGKWQLISGNQMGALLMDFIIKQSKGLTPCGTVAKSIVTNDLGAVLAKEAGLTVIETLTGFKYIGEKIGEFEASPEHTFVFGYEESYGYLVGSYARDKDAVLASMLICEMAQWHKAQSHTLVDALDALYQTHGFYLDALETIQLEDPSLSKAYMEKLRALGDHAFGIPARMLDYQTGIDSLPRENVLKYRFEDGAWIAIRPSGTEPKLKTYYAVCAPSKKAAQARLADVKQLVRDLLAE